MISLSSIPVDSAGSVVIDMARESKLDDSSRRVSRTKTLDGGCVIVDGGFTDADKTFTISTLYDAGIFATVKHLHEDSTLIHISMSSGFYSGVISRLSLARGTRENIVITILIKEKLT